MEKTKALKAMDVPSKRRESGVVLVPRQPTSGAQGSSAQPGHPCSGSGLWQDAHGLALVPPPGSISAPLRSAQKLLECFRRETGRDKLLQITLRQPVGNSTFQPLRCVKS